MPPREKPNKALTTYLTSKKNSRNYHASPIYHSFVFCQDKFRNVFRLPDFGYQELDSTLQLEELNYRAGVKAVFESQLIKRIFKSLVKPFMKGSIREDNINECLFDVFNRRLGEDKNPLSEEHPNVHCVPNEVKIYLMNMLMEMRISKDESERVDEFCEPDALRVLELGVDSLKNKYLYFGEFRLVLEVPEFTDYDHTFETSHFPNDACKDLYDNFTAAANMLIVAETNDQWKQLIGLLENGTKDEKALAKKLAHLAKSEYEIYASEVNRRTKLEREEQRQTAKMALNAQKQLGLVRTSGRLQAKDLERKRIEEEEKQRQDEEREREMERLKSMGVPMQMNGETKKQLTREERRLQREALVASQFQNGNNDDEDTQSQGDQQSVSEYSNDDDASNAPSNHNDSPTPENGTQNGNSHETVSNGENGYHNSPSDPYTITMQVAQRFFYDEAKKIRDIGNNKFNHSNLIQESFNVFEKHLSNGSHKTRTDLAKLLTYIARSDAEMPEPKQWFNAKMLKSVQDSWDLIFTDRSDEDDFCKELINQ